jgi:phasin family protein
MVNAEDFQNYGAQQLEAATQSAGAFSKGFQAIAVAMTDYSKKSFEDSTKVFEKLASAKSLDKAIEIQTEYAKSAYENFVSEAAKIGELYAELAKEAYKPLESYLAKFNGGARS